MEENSYWRRSLKEEIVNNLNIKKFGFEQISQWKTACLKNVPPLLTIPVKIVENFPHC